MELGNNILKIRKEKNLTQDDLAEKYFVTRQTISNWETGKSYPDLETLVKISDDFNISLDVLLKEDKVMVKEIDKKVKETKKYKNLLKYIIILICVLLIIIYKAIMLNKYQYSKREIDTDAIFNSTITIRKQDYDGERISSDKISIANLFDGYVDTENPSSYKVKYDGDKVVSSYSIPTPIEQYINLLSIESLEIRSSNDNAKSIKPNASVRKYLNKHNIKNDIDLLNYIKNNYYFKNNIFTLTSTMKNNYVLNSFVDVGLLNFKDITLINGSISGYIIGVNTSSTTVIKEIHIIKDDKQYIMTLLGEDITSEDFIERLLSTVEFK